LSSTLATVTVDTEKMTPILEELKKSQEKVENFHSNVLDTIVYFEFPAVRKGREALVIIVLFVLLCIWCYIQKKEEERDWQKTCLYGAFMALALFFITASPAAYWIVIFYPFLFLLIYTNQQQLRINLLLEKAFTITMFLVYVDGKSGVYGGAQTFENLPLAKWGIVTAGRELGGYPTISAYLEVTGLNEWMPFVTSICLASLIGLVWINSSKKKYDEELTDVYKIQLQHGFAIFSIILLYTWYILNITLIGWG